MGHLHLATTSSLLLFLLTILAISQAYYSNDSCIESERQALLQFRDSLIDKSDRLSSWAIGEDCCSWEGVGCDQSTGRVVKLDLHDQMPLPTIYSDTYDCRTCLGGQLNPSLVNLTNLRYLDLSLNNFSKIQIPTFIGLLKDLRYLNLSGVGFDGEIPHHLGNLSHLRYLDLGNNHFFPMYNFLTSKDLGWVARLSSLEGLILAGLNLLDAQGLRAISTLPSLTTLDLSDSGLHSIPHLSQLNFTSLSYLDLSFNDFNNYNIPLWLRNLTSLKYLDLYHNGLHGPIDDVFEQMTFLLHLDLEANQLNASIPKSLCNISSLTYLDLSFNGFQGSIPGEIGQLPKLTELLLSHNNLNGSIPSSLGQLTKLQKLDISYNSLTGVLCEHHFVKHGYLKELGISENLLSVNLSSSYVPPFQLRVLRMQSIKIGPQFPTWLRTQKELELLWMHNVAISDAIPSWFRVLCYDIKELDLSNNNITGNPLEFKQMKNRQNFRSIYLNSNKLEGSIKTFPSDIWYLDLSQNNLAGHLPLPDVDKTFVTTEYLILDGNRFTGSIPEDLCKLKTLIALDLANNNLSGKVPLCLGNLRDLEFLSLANNSLSGHIPSSLGNLERLGELHLNRNQLVGKLPWSMQNLIYLEVLDVGENGLKDIIPEWIGGRLSYLKLLRLQSNNFHGGISDKLCQLSNLLVLNLADNNFTGSIPHCFYNFTMMVSSKPGATAQLDKHATFENSKGGRELDYPIRSLVHGFKSISLSTNNLVGEIPEGMMDLVALQILNLSHNYLNGSIPKKIGILKQLETLDLSMNKLSGAIPPSFSTLNSLSSLNLSYNNLSGLIPSGNQLQTLIDPSIYEGNIGLCGNPLPKNCQEDKSPIGNGRILDNKGHEESDFSWFYAGVGSGFAVGFLGILGILHFKKSWRYAYFRFLQNAYHRSWVMTALNTSGNSRLDWVFG